MKLLLDTQYYSQKPKDAEIGKINNRITNFEIDITLDELATEIIKGKTFVPATLSTINGEKRRQIKYWQSQQIIALDIDKGLLLEDAMENQFIKDNATFLYTTFSHKPSEHKFRIIFALDQPVHDYRDYQRIWSYLYGKLPQADKACKDGTRLFFGGKEKFIINMNNRLNVDEIVRSKRGFEADIELIYNMSAQKPLTHKPTVPPIYYVAIQSKLSANIQDIRDMNIQSLQVKLQPQYIELFNMNDVHDHLKKQDLRLFLGIKASGNFCDIFHNESNPSSSIFLSNQENGHYLYKCHSASHHFCGTIVQVVERLLRCTIVEAEDFLMQVYNIKLSETELQKQLKKTLDANKRLLMSPELEQLYPNFYKVIKPFHKDLYILFDLVKEYLPTGDNPEIMFYHSLRAIAKHISLSYDATNRRMGFFVLLKLILKYDEDNIPENLLLTLSNRQKHKSYKYRNSVYEIPSYSYDLLSIIDIKCKKYIENGLTLKTISYEGIYRNFGIEEANRVFPQDKNKEINELNEFVSRKLEETMLNLIQLNGYTTEKIVLNEIKLYFRGQQQYKIEQLKRCLGEIIEKYCLSRTRLDKVLKEKISFEGSGYPFVIMFEQDLIAIKDRQNLSA
jgi:hypothetical protein